MTVTDAGPARTKIDPRLRARRIEVRRDEGRRRLHRLAALGIVAAVALVTVAVTRSALLDVDRIKVTGATHTPADQIQRATGIRRHSPMTDVDLDRARRNVLALPWVRSVSITRSWPATIRVVVTERTAVAALSAGPAGFALVDGDGRVLQNSPAPPAGFLLLANVPVPGPPGSTVDASATDALVVAHALPDSLRSQVSTIAVEDGGVVLRLVAGGVVRLGASSDLASKLRDATTMLAEADLTDLCAIDVRVPGAPSLTRGKGCL